MGPLQHPSHCRGVQGVLGRHYTPRRRICLLKGCEQRFIPSHPQSRYCSQDCHLAARRWRRWRASRTYRATDQGQLRRREQSRQYRQRLRAKRAEQDLPPAPSAEIAPNEPREGQRPAPVSAESCCARPGCFELFMLCSRSPLQKCCGWLCRQALRRVQQREARWRQWRCAVRRHSALTRGSPVG